MLENKDDIFVITNYLDVEKIRNFLNDQRQQPKMEELYSLYLYLLYCTKEKHLNFPINILKSESPDFILNNQIGLEVVTLATQKEKHACSLMEKEEGFLLETCFYAPGSTADIRDGIRSKGESLQGAGFGDNGMEQAWIACFLEKLHS